MVDANNSVDTTVRLTRSYKSNKRKQLLGLSDGSSNNDDTDNVDKRQLDTDMQKTRDAGNVTEGTTDSTNKADGPEVEEDKAAKAVEVPGDVATCPTMTTQTMLTSRNWIPRCR
jgi:hypothetical protein